MKWPRLFMIFQSLDHKTNQLEGTTKNLDGYIRGIIGQRLIEVLNFRGAACSSRQQTTKQLNSALLPPTALELE